MKIESPAFRNGGDVPSTCGCDGDDRSPALTWEGIPENAVSLALVVDDPDAPSGTWTHWLVWNLDPASRGIPEGVGPDGLPAGALQGANSWGNSRWQGPCPPHGTHRYFFRLYALDRSLELSGQTRRAGLDQAMEGHILARAELMGRYARPG